LVEKRHNHCNAWTYKLTRIVLTRKDDYMARARYLCRLYRSCWDRPDRRTAADDGSGFRGGRP